MSVDDEKVTAALVALANNARPDEIAAFEPSLTHQKLAGALFEGAAPTFSELAERAGISRATLYRVLETPAAVHWIVSHGSRLAEAALGAVHAKLLELCLKGKIEAIKLYLARFDPEFRAGGGPKQQTNTQLNFHGMPSDELRRFLAQQTRRVFGLADAPALPGADPEAQRDPGVPAVDHLPARSS